MTMAFGSKMLLAIGLAFILGVWSGYRSAIDHAFMDIEKSGSHINGNRRIVGYVEYKSFKETQ